MVLKLIFRVTLGILTIIFVLFPIIFLLLMILDVITSNNLLLSIPQVYKQTTIAIIIMLMVTYLLISIFLPAIYIVHIVINSQALKIFRILFALGILFIPVFAMPLYFLIYLLPNNIPNWAQKVTNLP
jgi:hypothetical protein